MHEPAAPLQLVWPTEYDRSGSLITTEFMLWDGAAPIARVWRQHDPLNCGAWRWSVFVAAPGLTEPEGLGRAGAAYSAEKAKALCEKAYIRLLAQDTKNRRAIQDHVAAVDARAKIWQLGGRRLATAA
jgi:hypothetical protein